MTAHFFTVDVEEHFQVSAFDGVVSRAEWLDHPSRLAETIPALLDLLARHDATGTFFVLGWVARHRPAIVRRIAAAGHEIASHGFWHHRVLTQSPANFRDDVRASKDALEDVAGTRVTGYRAPSFSITRGTEWAFDVLIEAGFSYDSSVFPIRRRGYGYAGANRHPHVIQRSAGSLWEFPLATARLAGVTLPAAGGGYLRQLPFALIRAAFRQATESAAPATFYIHPWEIDVDQPRLPVGWLTNVRHYRNLGNTMACMERLLSESRFTAIRDQYGHHWTPTAATSDPRLVRT